MTFYAIFDHDGSFTLSHPYHMDEKEKAVFEELTEGEDYFEVNNLSEAYELQDQTQDTECLICKHCKRYWVPPVRECKCGHKTFAPTHPDNKFEAENC